MPRAGQAFYRAESAQARDLAVLVAAVYKKTVGHLRVLDAMCGCGGRTTRYLAQVRSACHTPSLNFMQQLMHSYVCFISCKGKQQIGRSLIYMSRLKTGGEGACAWG
jgi:hypothetical protein